MKKTVVCIASDHGEMLGDHGDVDKSKPWEGSAHVPLMCMGPGIKAGATITTPVATMDMSGRLRFKDGSQLKRYNMYEFQNLGPEVVYTCRPSIFTLIYLFKTFDQKPPSHTYPGTFIDYAGATPAPGMTTQSFRPLLEGKPGAAQAYRSFVSSGLSKFRMVVWQDPATQKQWKYICCKGDCPGAPSTAPKPKKRGDFVEMLIDIIADPYDMHDLAPQNRAVVQRLQKLLPAEYATGCEALNQHY